MPNGSLDVNSTYKSPIKSADFNNVKNKQKKKTSQAEHPCTLCLFWQLAKHFHTSMVGFITFNLTVLLSHFFC